MSHIYTFPLVRGYTAYHKTDKYRVLHKLYDIQYDNNRELWMYYPKFEDTEKPLRCGRL